MSRRLKILHITSSWESGVGNELAEFAARLPPSGFETEICVLAGSHRRSVSNVPTTTLDLRWSLDVGTYFGIGRILRRFRPDVVHTWDTVAHSYGCFAAVRNGTQRILAEKRETDVRGGQIQKYLHHQTHRFIVPGKTDMCPKTVVIPPAAVPVPSADPVPAEHILATLGFPLAEPAGDYYPVFLPQYEPERRGYKPMPPHSTPLLIGIVLPLLAEHRILDALWVFETLNHVHLNFHAFIIGDGKDRELFLRARDRWKLFSRVHFLGNRHDTGRLLPHFDVLLHLSSSAEHSGTILSAMSCGVPVIALETPESRAYILDGTTGILIPSGGDFRFYRRMTAKRLLFLLENKELRQSMHTAAIDRIVGKFNFEVAVRRRIQVYHELFPLF